MKKSALIVLLVATSSFAFASEVYQGQAIISGYPTGESAVKGSIEEQLDQQVILPLSAVLSKMAGATIEINVTGSADQIGKGPLNDDLAEKRADHVAKTLKQKFHSANIFPASKGDEGNSRMVTVTWTITLSAQPKSSGRSGLVAIMTVGISGLMLVMVFTFRGKNQIEPQVAEVQCAVLEPLVMTPKGSEEWIEVKNEDATWRIRVGIENTREGEVFFLPFSTQMNPNVCITRKDRGNAKSATKQCLRNSYYQAEIERLIAAGTITVERKGI